MLPHYFELEQLMRERREQTESIASKAWQYIRGGRMMEQEHALKYPLGAFMKPQSWDREGTEKSVKAIAALPALLRASLSGWSEQQLERRYRPGGWTARQVVHHLADSHMNSFIRMKLALTEEQPVIKPYAEELWAELPDTKAWPVEGSIVLLEQLHARWAALLHTLDEAAWQRSFTHPELGTVRLYENAALYAWHGQHHLAHIQLAAKAKK
jgi:hypothetical protein